ncbi:helix-turn-helix domain-containing protein [Deinococcus sp. Arct2-2]|uniref:helix-turn-helix domain-containing protein n=1 Tax=Deinococcus sp. Arct2-2 TaxID=2568653 RepID=UPI0010A41E76|nr:helix-turn-helix domain-containing protein [Deinococcus sp. Arct2-2]THF71458.1 helix-turn-helix domain-containing protein [Deinococcus sp. Arct2-2]
MPAHVALPEPEEVFGLACWRGQPGAMATFHRHREIELNLVLRGSLTYLIGGRRLTVAAGQLALLWAAMPHRLMSSDHQTDVFWLTVPLGDVLRWHLPPQLVQAMLGGQAVHSEPTDASDQGRFEGWADLLKHPASAEARRIILLELEARLRRLALNWTASPPTGKPKPLPGIGAADHVERMAACVAERYQQPLKVAEIAAAAGLHPHYATTLFRAALGVGLSEYLTQSRIAHAQRLLLTTDLPVLDIMHEVGFRSTSRFHEAFVQACGVAPRAFRQRA